MYARVQGVVVVVEFIMKILVGMTGNVIVLSVTATGAHNLYPASHLLTTALLVFMLRPNNSGCNLRLKA